ncbi:hypothetical protein LCGC14_1714920 [marine sediment metagenome]|uniref:Uncharacterized protein n=1 Tax=marine sediment metagenome TaxID=412755 RepID=A0A0F9I1L9_9ZZZZ
MNVSTKIIIVSGVVLFLTGYNNLMLMRFGFLITFILYVANKIMVDNFLNSYNTGKVRK